MKDTILKTPALVGLTLFEIVATPYYFLECAYNRANSRLKTYYKR